MKYKRYLVITIVSTLVYSKSETWTWNKKQRSIGNGLYEICV